MSQAGAFAFRSAGKEAADLEAMLEDWVARHMQGYGGMMNFETIGGRIIEAHLRFADQSTMDPAMVTLSDLAIKADHLSTERGQKTGLDIAGKINDKGDLKGGAISLYQVKGGKWEYRETVGGAGK